MLTSKFITILLIVVMMTGMFYTNIFGWTDEQNENARLCESYGLLKGSGNGLTDDYLSSKMTRLQSAVIFVRALGLEEEALAFTSGWNFPDVNINTVSWAGGRNILRYLHTHSALGFVGYADGNFGPNDYMMAQSFLKVILTVLEYEQVVDFSWNEIPILAAELGITALNDQLSDEMTMQDVADGFVDALGAQIKGGSQSLADKLGVNIVTEVGVESSVKFISGVKLQNVKNIPEISEVTFKLASELELDYILVPVTYKNCDDQGNCDWSKDINYYHIFELSNEYNISVLPAFYKLGNIKDKDAQEYANYVIKFLDEFKDENIKLIELQNEPINAYDFSKGISHNFAGTPTDLANSNIAVYDEVKKKYPEIIIGSPGFLTSSVKSEDNNLLRNEYFDEYFNANPKFDVFMLHNYLRSSSYLQDVLISSDKYNFMSEYYIFDTYRSLLDDYGYEDVPILVTEGQLDMPFVDNGGKNLWDYLDDDDIAILLAERFVFTLSNKNNNVIGSMISGIESDYNNALFNYNENQESYFTYNKFDFYKKILSYTEKYPIYSKHIAGDVDSLDYWIEEFENDDEQKMWLAFCPLLIDADVEVFQDHTSAIAKDKDITYPQYVELNVGSINEVKIDYGDRIEIVQQINGVIGFVLDKTPVFIEEN
jgi:hypothetical protein